MVRHRTRLPRRRRPRRPVRAARHLRRPAPLLQARGPYVEYGVVEHRYATAHPDNYKHLVGLYSHTGFKKPIEYSASAFIGSAIGKLGRDGLLVRVPCRATGCWNYNGMLHGWALPPGPGSEEVLT